MRGTVGTSLELVNGRGEYGKAQAIAILKQKGKEQVRVLVEAIEHGPKSAVKIHLIVAILRAQRLDDILEKGTELGMHQLSFYPAMRSEKVSFSPAQQQRMERILIAAMKQCGRFDLPTLSLLPPIAKWQADEFGCATYYGDLRSSAPAFFRALDTELPPKIAFVTGPEAGFTETELDQLAQLHFQGVRLATHTLRAQTAPLAALSLLSQLALLN